MIGVNHQYTDTRFIQNSSVHVILSGKSTYQLSQRVRCNTIELVDKEYYILARYFNIDLIQDNQCYFDYDFFYLSAHGGCSSPVSLTATSAPQFITSNNFPESYSA